MHVTCIIFLLDSAAVCYTCVLARSSPSYPQLLDCSLLLTSFLSLSHIPFLEWCSLKSPPKQITVLESMLFLLLKPKTTIHCPLIFLDLQPNRVCFGEPKLRFLNHLHCNKTSLSLIYLHYDNGLLAWFLACVFALLWIVLYKSQHITLLFKTFQCLTIDLRKKPRLS